MALSKKRREYRNRLIVGPLLIVLLLLIAYSDEWLQGAPLPSWLSWTGYTAWPPGSILSPIIAFTALIAARELATILASKGIAASKRVMSVAAIAGLIVSFGVPRGFQATDAAAVVATAAVIVLAFSMIFYARNRTTEGAVAAAGGALLAFVYLGLMFGFVLAIRREHPIWVLLWIVLVTKSCDIGAYFTGRAFGKHKLIEWLSKGKTWEGLWGGLATATLVSYLGCQALSLSLNLTMPPLVLALLPGLMFGLVGQAGDLMESVFKRDANKKDSGQALPGMGGVLDVLDSTLLVCPLAYWWLRLMEHGGYLVPIGSTVSP